VIVGGQVGDALAGKATLEASGWPLLLLVAGGALLALSFVIPRGALARAWQRVPAQAAGRGAEPEVEPASG
jgi:hypothetical protein